MSTPIILLCGQAGSGKDTVGAHLASVYNGVDIALADPMKRMAAEIFGFSVEQLWGPSANRNTPDTRFRYGTSGNYEHAEGKLEGVASDWFPVLFPGLPLEPIERAFARWFVDCVQNGEDNNGLTPRFALQTLGTEFGRDIDPEVWSRYAVRTSRLLLGAEHVYTRSQGLIRDLTKKKPYDIVVITDGRFANEITNVRMVGGYAVHLVRLDSLTKEAMAAGIAGHVSEMGLDLVPNHFYDWRVNNDSTVEALKRKADGIADVILQGPPAW